MSRSARAPLRPPPAPPSHRPRLRPPCSSPVSMDTTERRAACEAFETLLCAPPPSEHCVRLRLLMADRRSTDTDRRGNADKLITSLQSSTKVLSKFYERNATYREQVLCHLRDTTAQQSDLKKIVDRLRAYTLASYEKAQDTLFTHAVVLLLRLTRDPAGRQSIPQLISLNDDGIQRTGLKDITAVHVLVALAERDSMGDGGAVWGTKVEPWADEQWVVPLHPIKQAIGPFLVLSAL